MASRRLQRSVLLAAAVGCGSDPNHTYVYDPSEQVMVADAFTGRYESADGSVSLSLCEVAGEALYKDGGTCDEPSYVIQSGGGTRLNTGGKVGNGCGGCYPNESVVFIVRVAGTSKEQTVADLGWFDLGEDDGAPLAGRKVSFGWRGWGNSNRLEFSLDVAEDWAIAWVPESGHDAATESSGRLSRVGDAVCPD
jgi:hypothetical protein